jgi:hypothetical protein
MTDPDGESESTYRRTILKSTAAAGLFGLTGVASASGYREVTFTSVSDEVFEYRVEVTGKAKRGGTYQSDSGDTVGDGVIHGGCAGGRSDSFLWTGEIADLQLSGPGKVFVDGKLVEDTTEDDDPKEREITLCATGEDTFRYALRTTHGVERGGTYESDDGDVIEGDSVEGATAEGRCDSFLITGEITELDLDGPGEVLLDGELVEDTTADKELPKELVVSTPGTDELLEYELKVTGDAENLEPDEDGPTAADEVIPLEDGTRIVGSVGSGNDRFAFSEGLMKVVVPDAVKLEVRRR